MVECKILLNNIDKIADFIKVVSKIEYDVDLVKGRYTVDAKSVVGVFTLDLSKEAKIIIHTDDENILDKFNEWRVD
jgi:phosphocarrier protein HPr